MPDIILALSLQLGALVYASSDRPVVLINDPSDSTSGKMKSDKDPLSGGGNIDPSSKMESQSNKSSDSSQKHIQSKQRSAEASGKVKSDKDPLSGGGNIDPSSKMESQSGQSK
jgi:hypothetical protein